MPAVLFDLDGVLYEGERAVPGAAEAAALPGGWRAQQTARQRPE